jgi:hypothetical protein
MIRNSNYNTEKSAQVQTARVHPNAPLVVADQTDSNKHDSEAQVSGSTQIKKYMKLVGTNRSNFIQKQFVTL